MKAEKEVYISYTYIYIYQPPDWREKGGGSGQWSVEWNRNWPLALSVSLSQRSKGGVRSTRGSNYCNAGAFGKPGRGFILLGEVLEKRGKRKKICY